MLQMFFFMARVQKNIVAYALILFASAYFWTYMVMPKCFGRAMWYSLKYCENVIIHAFNNLSVH